MVVNILSALGPLVPSAVGRFEVVSVVSEGVAGSLRGILVRQEEGSPPVAGRSPRAQVVVIQRILGEDGGPDERVRSCREASGRGRQLVFRGCAVRAPPCKLPSAARIRFELRNTLAGAKPGAGARRRGRGVVARGGGAAGRGRRASGSVRGDLGVPGVPRRRERGGAPRDHGLPRVRACGTAEGTHALVFRASNRFLTFR